MKLKLLVNKMATELKVKEREIVVPGEVLAEGMGYLPSKGTYREGDKVYASRLGLIQVDGKVLRIIPLSGGYLPKRNDVIICRVIDILMSGWRMDTFCPYQAVLGLDQASSSFIPKGADLTKYFDVGDFVSCGVSQVTSQNLVDVSMKGPGFRKLESGRVIHINPHKVPRVIGKQGSMVSMIKDVTKCRITVGQNGVVWLDGAPEDEIVAVRAIKMIEKLAHTAGLTDKIKAFLDKEAPQLKKGVQVEAKKKDELEKKAHLEVKK